MSLALPPGFATVGLETGKGGRRDPAAFFM